MTSALFQASDDVHALARRDDYSPIESSQTGWTLLCPCCGGDYLHHVGVVVYDRPREDAPSYETRIATGQGCDGGFGGDVPARGNPSSRRHGVAIDFVCELCGESAELVIAQHKGQSYLAWWV